MQRFVSENEEYFADIAKRIHEFNLPPLLVKVLNEKYHPPVPNMPLNQGFNRPLPPPPNPKHPIQPNQFPPPHQAHQGPPPVSNFNHYPGPNYPPNNMNTRPPMMPNQGNHPPYPGPPMAYNAPHNAPPMHGMPPSDPRFNQPLPPRGIPYEQPSMNMPPNVKPPPNQNPSHYGPPPMNQGFDPHYHNYQPEFHDYDKNMPPRHDINQLPPGVNPGMIGNQNPEYNAMPPRDNFNQNNQFQPLPGDNMIGVNSNPLPEAPPSRPSKQMATKEGRIAAFPFQEEQRFPTNYTERQSDQYSTGSRGKESVEKGHISDSSPMKKSEDNSNSLPSDEIAKFNEKMKSFGILNFGEKEKDEAKADEELRKQVKEAVREELKGLDGAVLSKFENGSINDQILKQIKSNLPQFQSQSPDNIKNLVNMYLKLSKDPRLQNRIQS